MDFTLKRLHKAIEAINTYYAFAVLLYVAALYIASHSQYFLWLLIIITPLIAGWTGYIVRTYLDKRNHKFGFRLLALSMSYEIIDQKHYKLRFSIKIKAASNRMMVYPVGYKWTGTGKASIPMLKNASQKILGVVSDPDAINGIAKVGPYEEMVSSEGDWCYWLVGLEKPLYKGEIAEIHYTQDFYDAKRTAKPYMNFMVNSTMQKLELNVKYPESMMPQKVSGSVFNLNDRRHAHPSADVTFDPDKKWATWTIEKPKLGRSYRINWQ